MSTAFLFVLSLVVAAGSLVYSIVSSEQAKKSFANVGEDDGLTLNDINVTTQGEGFVIPIVYGWARIAGSTIWWRAEKYNDEQFRVCLWQVICMGVVDSGWSLTPTIDERYIDFTPPIWPNPASYWYERVVRSTGEYNQQPPSNYLQYFPNNGDYATPLKGVAHVFIKWFELEPYVTNIPTFKYFIYKSIDISLPHVEMTSAPLSYGLNPAAIIYDLLTNEQYGLGINSVNIDWASFVMASIYFYEKHYALNLVINQHTPVRDIILKIQDWVECFLIKDENDKYTLIYFQDSDADNPITLINIDEEAIIFNLHRKSWDDTFNSFTANYLQFTTPGSLIPKFGDIKTASIKNEANIKITGNVRNKVIDLTAFNDPEGVRNRLDDIMKKESYPFITCKLTTNLKYSSLHLGNVVTLISDEYNFNGLFRITDIDIEGIDKNEISFDLIQVRELITGTLIDPTRAEGEQTRAVQVPCLAHTTFPPNSAYSNAIYVYIADPLTVTAAWGTGQTVVGTLLNGIDFTLEYNQSGDYWVVHLDEILFEEEILMNTLGLLNLDLFESVCSTPPES